MIEESDGKEAAMLPEGMDHECLETACLTERGRLVTCDMYVQIACSNSVVC